ncbi:metal-dependent hydrolase [Nonomuraea sp. WAC 01424]|uniref:amidohydrolase family protein n=1 Tax=Nonomuraea sp. WAC 01424 TaxID=2203200 RepID=UPI000F788562|nr:amidohydrolase family protein [Nonomuraea sp. WAC 01424]RSM97081.1 metal-dependent hydrolase [Nonomuraea sp. WAC 01424]
MIDVHTHCLLSEHWGCEWEANWRPVYGRPWTDVTPADYDAAMKGVTAAFVFGLRATSAGVATSNEFVARFCADTRTETVGFMALDPTDPDVLEQLADGVAKGLRGIKLYPVLAHFDPAGTAHDPFYAAAAEAGLVLLWHMGATPSPHGDLGVTNPLVVDAVARRHPGLTQIVAHLGHPWQRETMIVLRKNPRVFADVSANWARPLDGFLALVRAQEWGVTGKLLFGSDYPLWTPDEAVAGLRSLTAIRIPGLEGVRPETIERLLDEDPRELLGVR